MLEADYKKKVSLRRRWTILLFMVHRVLCKVTILLVFVVFAAASGKEISTLPTTDSEIGDGATIIRIEPDGLILEKALSFDVVKFPFYMLANNARKKYGLTEESCREYQAQFEQARRHVPMSQLKREDIRKKYGTPNLENWEKARAKINLTRSDVVLIPVPVMEWIYYLPRYNLDLFFNGAQELVAVKIDAAAFTEQQGFEGIVFPFTYRAFEGNEVVAILSDFQGKSAWKQETDATASIGIFSSSDGRYVAYVTRNGKLPETLVIVRSDMAKATP